MEVILHWRSSRNFVGGFLHVCGGDPPKAEFYTNFTKFSPRMWRWSYTGIYYRVGVFVFSTYVEVILAKAEYAMYKGGFLHVCGGDPVAMS